MVCVAWAASLNVQAQQAGKKYTLRECIDIAISNNTRVKRSLYNVRSFEIAQSQALFNMAPTLSLNAGGGLNLGRALNPVTNQFEANSSIRSLNPNLSSSWTLFNGLRLQYALRQSMKDKEASEEDLLKTRNEVTLSVVNAFLSLVLNKELFENATYQLNSSQQQLERIQKQVAAGSLPMSNQLTQEAQVATNEVNRITQENAVNLAYLQLKQAMQVPATEVVEVEIPQVALEDIVLQQNAQDIYQLALQAMPEIRSAALKVESAELQLKSARGALYPRLFLSAAAASNYSSVNSTGFLRLSSKSYQPVGIVQSSGDVVVSLQNDYMIYNNDEARQLKDNFYKTFNLTLAIPILQGLSARTNVQRAAVSKEIAHIAVTEAENTLRQSIETAYNDALAASKTYAASEKQVRAQEEAYRMNKQRFEIGALSFVEYHVSENDMFRAKSDLLRAKYTFIFRKKLLDFYAGKQVIE